MDSLNPEYEERITWPDKIHFIFSCIGLSVGFGNLWRFPSLAYIYGGGSFLISYVILLLVVGLPMCYMEMAIGQFCNNGPLQAMSAIAPICTGVGVAMTLASLILTLYYNTFVAYSFLYAQKSLTINLPWKSCDANWGADQYCFERKDNGNKKEANIVYKPITKGLPLCSSFKKGILVNESFVEFVNCTHHPLQPATEQYLEKYILKSFPKGDHMTLGLGDLDGALSFYLFLAWLLTFLCLVRGIQSTGKIMNFIILFPYVMLVAMFIVSLTQRGAFDGVELLLVPEWSSLINLHMWAQAASQMFYSLNVGYGGIMMYSSFNKIENKFLIDAVIVTTVDLATSVMSTCIVFATIGQLSHEIGKSIKEVTKVASGPGLAFVIYPEALLNFPFPSVWSFLFFLMLISLGTDSQFSMLETFLSSLFEGSRFLLQYRVYTCFTVCVICYLVNLTCVTKAGPWMISVLDGSGVGMAIIFIAFCEVMGVTWFYGIRRLSRDIEFMTGDKLNKPFRLCLKIISPFILLTLFAYSVITYRQPSVYGLDPPIWTEVLQWTLTCLIIIQIPIWAIAAAIFYKRQGDLKRVLCCTPDWIPTSVGDQDAYHAFVHPERYEELSNIPDVPTPVRLIVAPSLMSMPQSEEAVRKEKKFAKMRRLIPQAFMLARLPPEKPFLR